MGVMFFGKEFLFFVYLRLVVVIVWLLECGELNEEVLGECVLWLVFWGIRWGELLVIGVYVVIFLLV